MCSRYFLDADGNVIAYTFRVQVHEPINKRFNIAPTQQAPVIRLTQDATREVALLRWGGRGRLGRSGSRDLDESGGEEDEHARRPWVVGCAPRTARVRGWFPVDRTRGQT